MWYESNIDHIGMHWNFLNFYVNQSMDVMIGEG